MQIKQINEKFKRKIEIYLITVKNWKKILNTDKQSKCYETLKKNRRICKFEKWKVDECKHRNNKSNQM